MNDLNNLMIIGIATMLLLSLGIVFFVILYQRRMLRHQLEIKTINEQKQQEMLLASIQSEEQERMRIASELHDDVGATLSSIRLFLHTAAKKADDPAIINQSRELLDDSIQKIRNISHKLQPSTLQHLGLKASLESLADIINRSGNIRMQSRVADVLPRLHENTELAIYRVVQELINNIIKHAQASAIHLEMTGGGSSVNLSLSHNGQGLTDESYQELLYKKGAIGLKNIVNRLQSVHGSISFLQAGDGVYQAVITIPTNN